MKDFEKLSAEEQAVILARRAYQKSWRAKNKDKVKAHNAKFYKKQAEKMAAEKTEKETA